MFNFNSNLKKRNFLFTILFVAGFLTSNFDNSIKSNNDFTEAGISIIKWVGFADGDPENDRVYLFGITVYDGQKAAARKQARKARRAARKAT